MGHGKGQKSERGSLFKQQHIMKKSISEKIMATLIRGKAITPIQALNDFGCLRLSARIHDLRCDGWKIETVMKKTATGKTVAQYKLG